MTGAEAATLRSLQFIRPRIFHCGHAAMNNERHKSCLNKWPDNSTWKAGGDIVKKFIMKKMNILHNVVSNDIIYTFGGQGTQSALMVATLSLTNTVTFLTMLCALVDTIFAKTSRLLEIHCGTRMVFDNVNLQENSSGSLCSKRQSVRCDDNR